MNRVACALACLLWCVADARGETVSPAALAPQTGVEVGPRNVVYLFVAALPIQALAYGTTLLATYSGPAAFRGPADPTRGFLGGIVLGLATTFLAPVLKLPFLQLLTAPLSAGLDVGRAYWASWLAHTISAAAFLPVLFLGPGMLPMGVFVAAIASVIDIVTAVDAMTPSCVAQNTCVTAAPTVGVTKPGPMP